jgi:hypothetical protein
MRENRVEGRLGMAYYKENQVAIKRIYFLTPDLKHVVYHVSIYKEINKNLGTTGRHRVELLAGDYKEVPVEEVPLPLIYKVRKEGQFTEEYSLTKENFNEIWSDLENEKFTLFELPVEKYLKK